MTVVKDIMCDEDGDLVCLDGDLVIGDGTFGHQRDLMLSCEGDYKQFPQAGIGIEGYLNAEDAGEMLRKIRMQCKLDGMQLSEVSFNGTELILKGNY